MQRFTHNIALIQYHNIYHIKAPSNYPELHVADLMNFRKRDSFWSLCVKDYFRAYTKKTVFVLYVPNFSENINILKCLIFLYP